MISEPSRVDGPEYCSWSVDVSGKSRAGSVSERGMEHPAELRFVTYLSPGIPRAFYEAVVDHVRHALGRPASLSVESRVSGPMRGTGDPFSSEEVDVGFMCAPSFFWLRELKDPPVELLPAAPVFRDGRMPGQPAYFSEVIVHRENPVRSFLGLRGCSWAYNDVCSLSGYYNLLKKLAEMNEDGSFFGRMCCSESHLNSIELVARGEVDAAAIDSNVLRIKLRSGSPRATAHHRVLGTVPDPTRGAPLEPPPGTEESSARGVANDRRGSLRINHVRRIRPGAIRARYLRALRLRRASPAGVRTRAGSLAALRTRTGSAYHVANGKKARAILIGTPPKGDPGWRREDALMSV